MFSKDECCTVFYTLWKNYNQKLRQVKYRMLSICLIILYNTTFSCNQDWVQFEIPFVLKLLFILFFYLKCKMYTLHKVKPQRELSYLTDMLGMPVKQGSNRVTTLESYQTTMYCQEFIIL